MRVYVVSKNRIRFVFESIGEAKAFVMNKFNHSFDLKKDWIKLLSDHDEEIFLGEKNAIWHAENCEDDYAYILKDYFNI
jgi:hypothetical protein